MTRRRIALCAVLSSTLACGKDEAAVPGGGGGARTPMAFPVEVATVEARAVEYAVRAVGSLEAYEHVQVTARVAGVLDRVSFREGDVVTAGRVLAEIETERYRLAVDAALATQEKAAAATAEAQAMVARREAAQAGSPGLIPGEEMESMRTRVRTAAAEDAQAKSALAKARLDLRDAYVRSPVAGVIETKGAETGQYVQPGTVLATLVQRDPLLLRFSVPEPDAHRLHAGMTARFHARSDVAERSAIIRHVAEAADPATRMVTVTAEVTEAKDADPTILRPGAFAEVTVPVGGVAAAAVVPQTAIRPSERGFLAFVVKGSVAQERVLELGMRTADGLVEVKSGLEPGEQLVVRGVEPLRDGVPIRVAPAAATPGSPAAPAASAPAASAPAAAARGER